MKTLNISISDIEFEKFGVKKENMTFTEFLDLVSNELMKQNLDKCVDLAAKYGLSDLSMEEISSEVKAERGNAKYSN
jgi:hypothetical protein